MGNRKGLPQYEPKERLTRPSANVEFTERKLLCRIAAAAAHYDRMLDLLSPAATDDSGRSYEEFIGDLDKQKEHADMVLVAVKNELAAAAVEIEKALAAME